jgi:hypothetical protein
MTAELSNRTSQIAEAEDLAGAFLCLVEYFRIADHIQGGVIDYIELAITERQAVNAGWLRRVRGPGRLDDDWLVPSGELARHLSTIRGSAVLATWNNYKERRAA